MTTLIKYDPKGLLRDLRNEINRLFHQNLIVPDIDTSNVIDSQWSPRVDVKEKSDRSIILVDLPGIEAKDIEISAENNFLTIQGEKKSERQTENEQYSRVERFFGKFYRRLALPDYLQPEQISARINMGC